MAHGEEADAHPNPRHDHEWARRADLEESRRNRFNYGLRCRRDQDGDSQGEDGDGGFDGQ